MNIYARPLHPEIAVTLSALPGMDYLEGLWRSLERRATGTFFNSWSWIGPWLRIYAAEAHKSGDLALLSAGCGDKIVGLGIVCRGHRPWYLAGVGKILSLHQTDTRADISAFIEYNGFLVDGAHAHATMEAILRFLVQSPLMATGKWAWREFRIAGADQETVREIRRHGVLNRSLRHETCAWIDLSRVAPGFDGYLSGLSANTRGQIRRAIRIAQQDGTVALNPATTSEEGFADLARLRLLHEQGWERRGAGKGAYAHPLFEKFCQALLTTGLESGNIDILRLNAGNKVIGVLLNFIHAGHVYAYQSGFAYQRDNRAKPGMVSHALAVAHYKARGFQGYHFMAGENRYKSSLASDSEELTWLTIQRDDIFSRIENSLRDLKAFLVTRNEVAPT